MILTLARLYELRDSRFRCPVADMVLLAALICSALYDTKLEQTRDKKETISTWYQQY